MQRLKPNIFYKKTRLFRQAKCLDGHPGLTYKPKQEQPNKIRTPSEAQPKHVQRTAHPLET